MFCIDDGTQLQRHEGCYKDTSREMRVKLQARRPPAKTKTNRENEQNWQRFSGKFEKINRFMENIRHSIQ